ncbi:MAG: hypothetical protein ABWX65_00430 [Mycetocola sp.]
MSDRFTRVPDLSRGEWLRPMEDERLGSILSIVPPGFEAYARVLHPVERDRPRNTGSWLGVDQTTHFAGVDDIGGAIETELATWTQASVPFGTTVHAEAQYARLVRRGYGDADTVIAADGWRYSNPREGVLDAATLATASAVLARHTETPDAGIAAIWDGWGGLLNSVLLEEADGLAFDDRVAGVDLRAVHPPDPHVGSGILSPEISSGPLFDLHGHTGRHYVLFEAGATDFADVAWPERAPWVDHVMWAHSPNILWPDDHAWLLATEIDFDSTLIAGSTALIRELVQTPGLEVLPIRTDADLSWDGDRLNRPPV